MPKRIQRKRTKGWQMPPSTVYVGRPTKWGNPWRSADYPFPIVDRGSVDRICVEAYRAWLLGAPHWVHGISLPPAPDLAPLRGKDLACWCPLDRPCHADVLIELANS